MNDIQRNSAGSSSSDPSGAMAVAVEDTRAEIVAYLDREIDPDAAQQIEQRLSSDSELRRQLRELDEAWHLLDELPRSETDEMFTRRTIEMIAVEAESQARNAVRRHQRQGTWEWIGGVIALLFAGIAGYVVTAALVDRPNQDFLRNLPAIEHADRYRHVESLTWLEQLTDSGVFGVSPDAFELNDSESLLEFDEPSEPQQGEPQHGEPQTEERETAGDVSVESPPVEEKSPAAKELWRTIPTDLQERRSWVQSLPRRQVEELRRKRERFEALPVDERNRIVELHQQVESHSDREALLQTLVRYHQWLGLISPLARVELAAAAGDQRIEMIREEKQRQMVERLSRLGADELQPADIRALGQFMTQYIRENDEELSRLLPRDARFRLSRVPDTNMRYRLMGMYLLRSHPLDQAPDPDAAALARLEQSLSPDAQRGLASLDSPLAKMQVLYQWLRAAAISRMVPQVDDEELQKFYQARVSRSERERLENLSPDEMKRELKKLYLASRLRETGPWGRRGGGPNGGPGGGPGGGGHSTSGIQGGRTSGGSPGPPHRWRGLRNGPRDFDDRDTDRGPRFRGGNPPPERGGLHPFGGRRRFEGTRQPAEPSPAALPSSAPPDG